MLLKEKKEKHHLKTTGQAMTGITSSCPEIIILRRKETPLKT